MRSIQLFFMHFDSCLVMTVIQDSCTLCQYIGPSWFKINIQTYILRVIVRIQDIEKTKRTSSPPRCSTFFAADTAFTTTSLGCPLCAARAARRFEASVYVGPKSIHNPPATATSPTSRVLCSSVALVNLSCVRDIHPRGSCSRFDLRTSPPCLLVANDIEYQCMLT
jgi:hypothetical protein